MDRGLTLLKLIIKGFLIGASDIVPGISGGTMALVLGIYRDLINAIKSLNWQWFTSVLTLRWKLIISIPDFQFLIPLAIGVLLALLFFTQIVILSDLLISHPNLIYGGFFGLVLGSIFILLKTIKIADRNTLTALLAGLSIGIAVVSSTPTSTSEETWFLFLSGMLSGSAMVMPGISGAFVLVLLGKYSFVLEAVHEFNFRILAPFLLGIVFGLIFFVRLLAMMLQKFQQMSVAVISGFLIASLWVIWPFQLREYETIGQKLVLVGSDPIAPTIDLFFLVVCLVMLTAFILVTRINKLSDKISREKQKNRCRYR